MADWDSDTGDDAEEAVRRAVDGLTSLRTMLQQVAGEIATACTQFASLPPGADWDDDAGQAFGARARHLLDTLAQAREQTFDAVGRADGALAEILRDVVPA